MIIRTIVDIDSINLTIWTCYTIIKRITVYFFPPATGKTLYVDANVLIEMECVTNFADDGHCDASDVSFYVHTRSHDPSPEVMALAKEEIEKRTHGCFDLSELQFADSTGKISVLYLCSL